MSKYALKRVDVVKGRIRIFKLLINQECEFDTFCGILLNGKKKDAAQRPLEFKIIDLLGHRHRSICRAGI